MSLSDLGSLGGLLPLLVLVLAFLKMVVVLTLLRQALAGALPSSVVVVLALLLSALVMAPVARRSHDAWQAPAVDQAARLERAANPLRDFLRHHTAPRELGAMQELAQRIRSEAGEGVGAADSDLSLLLPAYALGELRVAFQIGCLLLLPFLLLDLLCAALLTGLSLPGLSPAAVALPFKILLFVLCDGWNLLARALALGYP